ncbi:hypothetical protein GCT13_20195 [Paraburkholderia sp. CNPSo 3157]|uniref:Uncharacterized protein n=1 Tax=Paraburkholderia franconis TaxID=2654983 RepID=A0A7X1TH46_9BURK|nr:hypothetical protein [Paraburkholderia franconis]
MKNRFNRRHRLPLGEDETSILCRRARDACPSSGRKASLRVVIVAPRVTSAAACLPPSCPFATAGTQRIGKRQVRRRNIARAACPFNRLRSLPTISVATYRVLTRGPAARQAKHQVP